jgi:hypothetical protein
MTAPGPALFPAGRLKLCDGYRRKPKSDPIHGSPGVGASRSPAILNSVVSFFSLAGIFGEREQSTRSSGGTLAASAVRPLNKFRRIRCTRWLLSLMSVCVCAFFAVTAGSATGNASQPAQSTSNTPSVNVVVQWNRTLLIIVRTPGAQPATVHPTRSFAIMHAAIYDAVNAIDRTHTPYSVRLSHVSRFASQDAAAATAAHEVLAALYPKFQPVLDDQLQQSLAVIPGAP